MLDIKVCLNILLKGKKKNIEKNEKRYEIINVDYH